MFTLIHWKRLLHQFESHPRPQIKFDSVRRAAIECAPFEVYLRIFRNNGYENIFRQVP